MFTSMKCQVCLLALFLFTATTGAVETTVLPLADYFKDCKVSKPDFDNCMKNALNAARPLFIHGVPEYGIKPFDPHFFKRESYSVGGPGANFTIILSDSNEYGWAGSVISKFESDLPNYKIRYQMVVPDKIVTGRYEMEVFLGGSSYKTKGLFNFRFVDWAQTMTVTRLPTIKDGVTSPGPIVVDLVNTGNRLFKWHFTNLLKGNVLAEKFADYFINFYSGPLLVLSRPGFNSGGSQGFTRIFNESFKNFPFDTFFS